jgi:predicted anti-sigma-YlaC factor YlaD
MNAKFVRHCPDGCWEEYALGMLSDEDCKPLEEHLLICSACQDLLAEVDEYIRVAKTALATREPSGEQSLVTDFAE